MNSCWSRQETSEAVPLTAVYDGNIWGQAHHKMGHTKQCSKYEYTLQDENYAG